MHSEKLHINGTYTHEFHPYPAKFPPKVIRELILKYSSPSSIVLDPFCGSGTALVEARLEKRNAIGIELNPVGALISKVKSSHYSNQDLADVAKFIKQHQPSNLQKAKIAPVITFPNKEHWFTETAEQELSVLKYVIEKAKVTKKAKELLLTAFSKIIVPVSNQDTETRYARVEKKIEKGSVYSLFIKTCENYLKYITLSSRKPEPDNEAIVHEGDIAKHFPKIKDASVDLILTSPPYINSFDYYLYHKQRIHWLGKDPKVIRSLEIGNHHRIDTKSHDDAVEEYLGQMLFFLSESYRVLKNGGHVAILIGDGIVKGKVVFADQQIIKLSKEVGFSLKSKATLELSSVSKTFIKEKDRLAKKKHHTLVLAK